MNTSVCMAWLGSLAITTAACGLASRWPRNEDTLRDRVACVPDAFARAARHAPEAFFVDAYALQRTVCREQDCRALGILLGGPRGDPYNGLDSPFVSEHYFWALATFLRFHQAGCELQLREDNWKTRIALSACTAEAHEVVKGDFDRDSGLVVARRGPQAGGRFELYDHSGRRPSPVRLDFALLYRPGVQVRVVGYSLLVSDPGAVASRAHYGISPEALPTIDGQRAPAATQANHTHRLLDPSSGKTWTQFEDAALQFLPLDDARAAIFSFNAVTIVNTRERRVEARLDPIVEGLAPVPPATAHNFYVLAGVDGRSPAYVVYDQTAEQGHFGFGNVAVVDLTNIRLVTYHRPKLCAATSK